MNAYQLTLNAAVIRLADGATIPDAPNNIDWQDYQAWLAAGNTPAAASSPTLTPIESACAALISVPVTFTTSTTLSATYGLDDATRADMLAEMISLAQAGKFTNGTTSITWHDAASPPVGRVMNPAQFAAFATAIGVYVSPIRAIIRSGSGAVPTPQAVTVNA